MSGIVLSASVRQNLLSLQSTADLLATTQNRLSTGKKVNSALDNPTNFFTAQSLDNRASDINNLLDGIGNGVQVLQAANTGITSLQKLVDYREVDRQPGAADHGRLFDQVERLDHDRRRAPPTDLRGTTTFASAVASSNVLYDGTAGGTHAGVGNHDARRHLGCLDRRRGERQCQHAGCHHHRHADRRRQRRADDCGDHQVRRRRHLHRQRQDHHLQGRATAGGGPASPAVRPSSMAATSSPTATATRPSIRLQRTPTATVGDVLTAIDLASGVQKSAPSPAVPLHAAAASGQTTSSHLARRGPAAELDRRGSQRDRQGRLPQGARPDHRDRLRQCHGAARSAPPAPATLGTLIQDGSTLNVDGKIITLQERADPCQYRRAERLRLDRQRQCRHRRQRQLDRLSAERHDRRRAEGDRSCHRRLRPPAMPAAPRP